MCSEWKRWPPPENDIFLGLIGNSGPLESARWSAPARGWAAPRRDSLDVEPPGVAGRLRYRNRRLIILTYNGGWLHSICALPTAALHVGGYVGPVPTDMHEKYNDTQNVLKVNLDISLSSKRRTLPYLA